MPVNMEHQKDHLRSLMVVVPLLAFGSFFVYPYLRLDRASPTFFEWWGFVVHMISEWTGVLL